MNTKMTTCSIDPYGLLGASVSSTLLEVKQAYHALSLLVHPDKGGSADDMIMVHNAYKYVTSQLSEVNRSVTVEDLEGRFAAFCQMQERETPALEVDIRDDANARQFHEAFVVGQSGVEGAASFPDGYGASMEPSGYAEYVPVDPRRARAVTEVRSCEEEQTGFEPFETQVVTYVEPETSATDTRLCFSDLERTFGLEDYGSSRPFQMTDYRAAFTTTPERLPDVSEVIQHRTFEELVQQHRSIPRRAA